MKLTLFYGLIFSSLAASTNTQAQVRTHNNALSPAESKDGYQLLWNGRDFSGWKTYRDTLSILDPKRFNMNLRITHADGSEASDTNGSDPDFNMIEISGGGPSLFTRDTSFRDFDIKMEWQSVAGKRVTSGLNIHYLESMGEFYGASSPQAMFVNKAAVNYWSGELMTAGCNFEMVPLLKSVKNPDGSPNWVKPDGQWNEFRIISHGSHTAHFGNGMRLLEYQMFSAKWNVAYSLSKFIPYPGYKDLHPGSFLLVSHGDAGIKFRNIRIKRLTRDPWAADSPYLNNVSLAKGDTALIDALPTSVDLFPVTTSLPPPGSEPVAKILIEAGGASVSVPHPEEYSFRLNDVQGVELPCEQIGASGRLRAFLLASPRVAILSLWRKGAKIQERILTTP